MNNGYWRKKDGELISIKKMEESHIRNCIAMLKREMPGEEHDDWLATGHWSAPVTVFFPGRRTYRNKINEFEYEIKRRHTLHSAIKKTAKRKGRKK